MVRKRYFAENAVNAKSTAKQLGRATNESTHKPPLTSVIVVCTVVVRHFHRRQWLVSQVYQFRETQRHRRWNAAEAGPCQHLSQVMSATVDSILLLIDHCAGLHGTFVTAASHFLAHEAVRVIIFRRSSVFAYVCTLLNFYACMRYM